MFRINIPVLTGVILLCPLLAVGLNLLFGPESVEYDAANGRYLISNWYPCYIVQLDSSGLQRMFNTDFQYSGTNMGGLHIVDNTLYAATCYGDFPGIWSFDLETGDTLRNLTIPGMILPNDITSDTSGYMYVTDVQASKIYKVKIDDFTYSIFVSSGINNPNGICFDRRNNRLLVVSNGIDSPIQAVSLEDSTVSIVVNTDVGNHDGITEDNFGNFYVSSWGFNTIYRYESTFTEPPELISSGHLGSADIFFDKINNILAVPNISSNFVDYIDMFITIDADTTWGWPPLTVNFTGGCDIPANSWTWDFGDGDSAFIQSAQHTYEEAGVFDVTLAVDTAGGVMTRFKKHFIVALSDSIIASQIAVDSDTIVKVEIFGQNSTPLEFIQIPVEYGGMVSAALDSVSMTGCRTEHLDTVKQISSDIINKRKTFRIYNFRPESEPLDPGSGPILNLYFTIPSSAVAGQSVPVIIDGYSYYSPEFRGLYVPSYAPAVVNGEILIFECGNVNSNGSVDLLDITYLIAYLYKGGPPPNPIKAANVNGDGAVNLLDITYLISYLYKDGPEPNCP